MMFNSFNPDVWERGKERERVSERERERKWKRKGDIEREKGKTRTMTVLNEQLSGGGVGGRVGGARGRTTAGAGVESCAGGVAVRSRVLTDNAGKLII